MTTQFCTHCGAETAIGFPYCAGCGRQSTDAATTPEQARPLAQLTPEAIVMSPAVKELLAASHTKPAWKEWLDVISKAAGLGTPLIFVFDFVSPHISLLPVAACIALAGLLATVSLRKYVAPSLPATSAFRQALAPELGLHRSRLVIGTGLLSALMVTGAAWSNANAPGGGIIASKFDAAKNAQMQLGILQAVQKEQRGQTAVLEDIREGRTLNPRRELSNQGILWTYGAFDEALEAKDLAVVSLFIAGGMTWGPHAGLKALWSKQDAISDQLISRPELLDPDAKRKSRYGCYNYIQVFNQPSNETAKLTDLKQIRPRVLREQDKQWLKLLCGDKEGQAAALEVLQDQMAKFSVLPAGQCRQRLTNNDASAISFISIDSTGMFPIPFERNKSETATLRQAMLEQPDKDNSYTLTPMTPENNRSFPTPNPDAQPHPNKSKEASKKRLTPQVFEAINDYCSMVSRRSAEEYNGWTVESMKQIVAALN